MNQELRTYLTESEVSQEEFAKQFGVTQTAIHKWLKNGVPAKRAFHVSKVTGIPPERLCPELFQHAPLSRS